MENTNIDSITFDKKTDGWDTKNLDNFTAPNELTVTITLNEYRSLVSGCATSSERVRKAEDDKWERLNEITSLKKKVNELDSKLCRYISKYGSLDTVQAEED